MLDYSREEFAERDRAEQDYWDKKALLPTKADLEFADDDDEDEPEEEEPEELDWE